MAKYVAKDKVVTVGGRDIRLSECTQEQLAKIAKLFPSLIEEDKPKTKKNDLPQSQPSEPDGSLNAE